LLLTGAEQPWAVKKGAVWWLRYRPRSDDGHIVLQAVQSPDSL
jgi:phosphohistidine phosphatase